MPNSTDGPDHQHVRDLIDRAAITRAIIDWGLWRDTGRWDRLRTLYTPDATMHTTWFTETRMILMVRAKVADVAVDVTCYGRFYDRFVRYADGWRIERRVPIYDKDRLDPVDPSRTAPLDTADLAQFAEGYRHLAYVQSLGGATLTPGLPTAGSDEEAHLCAEGSAWLDSAG